MKIYGIANNYRSSSEASPNNEDISVYLLPDTSLLKDGKPMFLYSDPEDFRLLPTLVARIDRVGKSIAHRFAHRYYNEVAIGFNACESALLEKLKASGRPWSDAVAFDYSAPLGRWTPLAVKQNLPSFSVRVNGEERTVWNPANLRNSLDELISALSVRATLKTGDLIFFGLSDIPVPISLNDRVEGFFNLENPDDKPAISFKIK